jgi:ribose transport system ATP-binding protein
MMPMATPDFTDPTRAESDIALAVRGVSKRFGGTLALDGVDLTIRRGEIHALLGANGAGKSTLIKILAGVYSADAGNIELGGRPLGEPGKNRISFVHQDLALIEMMSVGENMAMGFGYPRRFGLIDWRAINRRAAEAFDRLGCPLQLDKSIAELSQAERSIVAIARALTDEVDLLVLDEPTASLPDADVGKLFRVLNRLRQSNVGIIYVTHRLDEVFKIADAVTVLRDGKTVASDRPIRMSSEELVAKIVGKVTVAHKTVARKSSAGPRLVVDALTIDRTGPISFTVAAGEIVGLAGLRGQGHEIVGRAIAGLATAASGSISLDGKDARFRSPREAIASGIGFATGKRTEEGMAGMLTVRENLFLNPQNFGRGSYEMRGRSKETAEARAVLQRFDVRPADPNRDISTLSGGNQQKVVLARWAGRNYRLLVFEDPTIGVDFGAKTEIYRMLAEDAARGTACIIVSSDLDELVQVCHRVLAFNRGRIVADLQGDYLDIATLTREVSGREASEEEKIGEALQ